MPYTIWLTTCISSAVVYTLFEYVTSMQIRVRPKKKSSEVCMKSRSTPASLLFKGLVTEHTTLKWSTLTLQNSSIFDMNDLKEGNIRQYDKLSLCRKCWPSNQMQLLRRGKQRREQTNATKTRRPRPYALEVNQRHTSGTHALWPLHQSCFKKRNSACGAIIRHHVYTTYWVFFLQNRNYSRFAHAWRKKRQAYLWLSVWCIMYLYLHLHTIIIKLKSKYTKNK